MKRKFEDMECEDLRLYCPLPEEAQGGPYGTPYGYYSCEGEFCKEAYEAYLESGDDVEESEGE
jgi:hypothetical protein